MADPGVQFKGIEAAVKAFEFKHIDTWAFFQGEGAKKELFHKGEGSDELREFLTMLKKGGARGKYKLCVYQDLEPAEVKAVTPHDGCFYFSLHTDEDYYGSNDVLTRIHSLEEKVNGTDQDDDDDDDDNPLGIVGRILEHDAIAPFAPQLISKLIDGIFSPKTPAIMAHQQYEQAGAVNGIPRTVESAVDRLRQKDPKLADHLHKLADIAEKNPGQFQFLLSTLEKMG